MRTSSAVQELPILDVDVAERRDEGGVRAGTKWSDLPREARLEEFAVTACESWAGNGEPAGELK